MSSIFYRPRAPPAGASIFALTPGPAGAIFSGVMPVKAILLVLISGLIHSVWNLFVKKARDPSAFFMTAIGSAVLLYTPAFFIFILPRIVPIAAESILAVIAAGVTEGLYFIFLTAAYTRGDLSLVYPVSRGSSPLFIVAGAFVLLGERVSPVGAVGIAFIVAGVTAVAWPRPRGRATFFAVAFSIITGAAIAAHNVCYKWALQSVPSYAAIYGAWAVAGPMLAVYCVLRKPERELAKYVARELPRAAAVGVLSLVGFMCALVAMEMTLLSYVGAARNAGMIFGVVFGVKFLGEGGRWRRLAGAVAVTAGVALMAFA